MGFGRHTKSETMPASLADKHASGVAQGVRGFAAGLALPALLLTTAVEVQADYFVDFEGDGETKSAYATGTVALGDLDWELTEALIGALGNDKKNGLRSMRMRRNGDTAGLAEMRQDKTKGLGTLSFLYARYGDETGQPHLHIEVSVDGGASWEAAGDPLEESPESLTAWETELNLSGNVRIRFRTGLDGTNQRRFNIDDIRLTDYGAGPPRVTTADISSITSSSAQGGGEVLDEQGATVTLRGLAWNTAGNPTTNDHIVTAGTGTGTFTAVMTDLTAGQTYYVRAFAVNAAGTGYGSETNFITAGLTNAPLLHTVTERRRDGFTLTWNLAAGAAGYQVDVASTPCFHPGGAATVFQEPMGVVSSATTIADHDAAGGFDYSGIYTYDAGGADNPADVRQTSVSEGYTNAAGNPASGGANIWFTSTEGQYGFGIGNIDIRDRTGLNLGFGYRKESRPANADFSVEYSSNDGLSWRNVTLTGLPPEDAPTGWYPIGTDELPLKTGAQSLALRWIKRGTTAMRIDDIVLLRDGGASTLHPDFTSVFTPDPVLVIDGLPAGLWWVRVRAVGAGDCVSPYSEPQAVDIPRSGTVTILR